MLTVEEISATQAAKLLTQQTELGILDIRIQMEYDAGHLKNAQLIDFYDDSFRDQLSQLPGEKTYLLYCRSGVRSADALEVFEKLGFKKIYHLTYGILDWIKAGLPLEK